MGGIKRAKQFFQKHTNSASKKCCGEKIVVKKCENRFFYIYTNIVNKKWGGKKRAKQFFQKHRYSARKKSSEKRAKNVFLYSHEYRDQKVGGIKRAKQFFPTTLIVRAKNVGKKIVGKKYEKSFFIFTRIS